jgi:hypothetical protein
LVGLEADPLVGDLEKDLLNQLAAQDVRFIAVMRERDGSHD